MVISMTSTPLLALYISLATCTAVSPTFIHFSGSIWTFACTASDVRLLDVLMTPGVSIIIASTCLAAVLRSSMLSPPKLICVLDVILIMDIIPLPDAETITLIFVISLSFRL